MQRALTQANTHSHTHTTQHNTKNATSLSFVSKHTERGGGGKDQIGEFLGKMSSIAVRVYVHVSVYRSMGEGGIFAVTGEGIEA